MSSPTKRHRFKQLQRQTQATLHCMQDEWWVMKAAEIQHYCDTKNSKIFFGAIKTVFGPPKPSNAPLKSADGNLLKEKNAINKKWLEHFTALLNRPSMVSSQVLEKIPQRPNIDTLDCLPTLQELNVAIKQTNIWEEEDIPQFRDATIIPLYKNKGSKAECGNYRGISLLSIAGKLLAHIVLNLLITVTENHLTEAQCGFWPGRTPILFNLFFTCVLNQTLSDVRDGVHLKYRTDGSLFDLHRLKAKTKTLSSNDGVYIHTRHDGKLFNLARLRAKTKTIRVLLRELLFADDAALASHSEQGLQRLLDCFSSACHEFSLTISIKKTVVMVQNAPCPPLITVNDSSLAVVDRILGITWMDRVTNSEVLRRSRSRTMYAILSERRLRWLGHVRRMDQDRIPKDLLYGQLERGTRKKGRPHLRYKDVCKRDLRAAHINSESWENIALNRTLWKSTVKTGLQQRLPLKDRSIQPQENLFKEARAIVCPDGGRPMMMMMTLHRVCSWC
ncbi:hypothetical protein Bbelb_443750 [Branchiostoma belcheri]|nr:hypothetical protein Bbelb_443750 [Branchiostoma belcheri]